MYRQNGFRHKKEGGVMHKYRTWALLLLLIPVLLMVSGYDQMGDLLKRTFGRGSGWWVVNTTFIVLIVLAFTRKK